MNVSKTGNGDQEKQPMKDATFVVLDFETVTPAGRPPEPLELAALQIAPGLSLEQTWSKSWLIRPPEGVPLTPFDTRQTGIQWNDIANAPDASSVLQDFDAQLPCESLVLIAQNAHYETAIIQRFAQDCPFAASLLCIDTIALAKQLILGLPNYKLDTLARHFAIPLPQQRHRAMPDVRLTAHIFLRLAHLRLERFPNTLVADLKHIAGVKRSSEEQDRPTQSTLW